jgi:hypothetical protein
MHVFLAILLFPLVVWLALIFIWIVMCALLGKN